jgi:DNA-directed RNA polymerase subunit G
MSSSKLLSFRGSVVSVEKELIPKMYITRIVSDDGSYEVEMDTHEDLITFKEGDRVEVELSRDIPQYRDGVDFVGRGTVVSKRVQNSKHATLISIGGLLFIVKTPEELPILPTEKVYVKVAPIS